jgi:hypothetical protein
MFQLRLCVTVTVTVTGNTIARYTYECEVEAFRINFHSDLKGLKRNKGRFCLITSLRITRCV